MKRILLLGGMTPDVTALYYNIINRKVRESLGSRNAAPLYLYSANLEEMIQNAGRGDWKSFAATYEEPISTLAGKVDGVAICAIIAHKVAGQLSKAATVSNMPLLHIADFLKAHIITSHPQVKRLGLLGPKITMLDNEDPDFFIARLQPQFQVLIPNTPEDVDEVNRGMMEEVAKGAACVTESTKAMFVTQAKELVRRGAEVIILGSTDLGFVIRQEDVGEVPIIEPASVHAEELARWICEKTPGSS